MTWLKELGDLHQKFYNWASDSTIAKWKRFLRMILFYAADFVLGLIAFWGILILVVLILSKFIKGEEPVEILED